MKKMSVKKQILLLKIINIFLIVLIVLLSSMIYLRHNNNEPHDISGELIFIEDESVCSNPEVGVYLKLILDYPEYAKFGWGFLILSNSTNQIGVEITNTTHNEKDGFFVDVQDLNNDGVMNTGDVFHIYGHTFDNYTIRFCIEGVRGSIYAEIPA